MGIAAVLAALLAPLVFLLGISIMIVTASTDPADPSVIRILSLGIKIASLFIVLTATWYLGSFAWHHLGKIPVNANVLVLNKPLAAFSGLVALGTVLPDPDRRLLRAFPSRRRCLCTRAALSNARLCTHCVTHAHSRDHNAYGGTRNVQ
jgi:hypothetical protein